MSNDKAEGLSSAAACAGDKEMDPYWWNQSTSSKNLMDSADDGLWDGLFQEANSVTLEQWENKLCIKNDGKQMTDKMSPSSSGKKSESVSMSTSITMHKKNISSSPETKNRKPSSQITEDSSAQESDISNRSQTLSDLTVHLDYTRLKTEHQKLKKYFESACDSRYKTPPVHETVRRLCRAEPVALDLYKSHREKMELLRAALAECDWDGIMTVLLFIKRTLSNALFRQCLMEHPKAARHYITYLRETGDSTELADTLFGLGQTAEAAMVEFGSACKWTNPQRRLEALRNCLLSGFSHPQLANERRSLQEWIELLETHLKRPH